MANQMAIGPADKVPDEVGNMAYSEVLALALSIPLLLAVSLLYDALVLRWRT